MLPNKQEIEQLMDYICQKTDYYNVKNGLSKGASRRHYLRVAENARLIASKTPYLNPEKAYILGLLHDYGEYIEQKDKRNFHGTAGYDEMMLLGFDEVARVCVSHSFFEEPINIEDYVSYDENSIKRAALILEQQGFDDYDRLIHLSDLMVLGDKLSKIDERLDFIGFKYHVSPEILAKKKQKAAELKAYFDNLCGQNIYEIVGLNDD